MFERDQSVISRHISNIFKEDELDKNSVYAKNAYTASDGKNYDVAYYNLDMIISLGYRVKSKRGIKFRQWANRILKEYLINGYVLNISMLEKENKKLKELQNIVSVVHRVVLDGNINQSEIKGLLSVVKDYEFALDLLDQYDHKTVSLGN